MLRFEHNGMELSLEILDDAQEKQLRMKEVPTIIRYDVPKGSQYTAVSHDPASCCFPFPPSPRRRPLCSASRVWAWLARASQWGWMSSRR